LTIKSTEAHVLDLHKAGKLVHHNRDLWPDDTCLRRLWLHPNVQKWAALVGGTAQEREYFAKVRAFLSAFVGGADFDDDDMLKALSQGNDGLWEFRVTFQPQARVVGAFLRPGEFVALSFADRGDLQKAGFGPLIRLVKSRWNSMFPNYGPLKKPRTSLLVEFDDDL
jgi:hypothetical protein